MTVGLFVEPKSGGARQNFFRRFAPDVCHPHFQIRSGANGLGLEILVTYWSVVKHKYLNYFPPPLYRIRHKLV